MTFADMQTEVRRRLSEETTVFFSDEDIEDALNDGLEELSDSTEWYERQATLPLLAGRTYYDLSRLLPDTFLSLRRCWNTVTNFWLLPSDMRELDGAYRRWIVSNGQPERVFLRGIWKLGVWLRASADQRGLRIYYTAIAPAMTEATEEPAFQREFHYGLVEYALSDCLAQQRETKKALSHWEAYLAIEEKLRRFVDGRQSIARLNVL